MSLPWTANSARTPLPVGDAVRGWTPDGCQSGRARRSRFRRSRSAKCGIPGQTLRRRAQGRAGFPGYESGCVSQQRHAVPRRDSSMPGIDTGAALRPALDRSRSVVAFRRIGVVTGLQLCEPSVRLFASYMPASRLIVFPGIHSGLKKRLALLLAIEILLDGLAHQPMRRALALAR